MSRPRQSQDDTNNPTVERVTTKVLPNTTHELPELIDEYARASYLEKPEELVLATLRERLPRMRMLDIGVGGGRTTPHFAALSREYVGIDFDENMIEACRRRFSEAPRTVSFVTCDARAMDMFASGSFDFILFSFNGLDYLGHEDRLRALREIRRVGAPGATFCFSSHNLNSIDDHFRVPFRRNLLALIGPAFKSMLLRSRNEPLRVLRAKEYAIVNDGAYHRRLKLLIASLRHRLGYNYYIRPGAQVRQLESLGLAKVRVYALDGRELKDPVELERAMDHWLYYVCEF